jgi:pimeloyl-ACP methyl ester carboxylesterase
MTGASTEEIVFVTSEDGIKHAGLVIRPAGRAPAPLPVLWVHGHTGRFYEPHAVAIGRLLAEQGSIFVAGNNRGHDVGANLHRPGGAALGGAWWEKIDEAPLDVGAWVGFAAGLGSGQVVLLGHSLGGVKVVLYQSQRQDPRVRGLIAASPGIHGGEVDPALLAQAERLVSDGRGEELLAYQRRSGPARASAQTIVSRAHAALDLFGLRKPDAAISRIRCPLLVFFGTNEPHIGTAAELETVRRNATGAPTVEAHMIEGADHVYTGRADEVAGLIARFARSLG